MVRLRNWCWLISWFELVSGCPHPHPSQLLPAGLKSYGPSLRPACRVLRYEADKACAAASAAAEARAMAPPSGRRHDAFLAYLGSVRKNEDRWGLETMQVIVAVGLCCEQRVR